MGKAQFVFLGGIMMKMVLACGLLAFSIEAFAADIPMSEVEKHKAATDCWIAIDGKVYDITKYIAQHKQNLEKACGTEASKCWADPAPGKKHSDTAAKMMKYFIKGNLAK
jgi:cytochrome b involved in lipid metabolism